MVFKFLFFAEELLIVDSCWNGENWFVLSGWLLLGLLMLMNIFIFMNICVVLIEYIRLVKKKKDVK